MWLEALDYVFSHQDVCELQKWKLRRTRVRNAGGRVRKKKGQRSQLAHFADTLGGYTLLGGSVGRHGPLAHDMVPLVGLAHHAHWVLLTLVVLCTTTRRHVILLRGRLLVHCGACCTPTRRVNSQTVPGTKKNPYKRHLAHQMQMDDEAPIWRVNGN